ncbi:hypothetical protein [Chachezhania antarctica]|uniref:hypothetical protein n=1 Tax=Chachezhania antarctica TaxID=2340860 RepID=UPI000EAF4A82|nr:hypothetical protein [Chachezhania antarctica]|tara:strand:+ start:8009 stop:8455 length:447 start_codon:yes stop_codon:yes gene_type:complete
MIPHPDFASRSMPRVAKVSGLTLSPLGPDDLDEDFEAVSTSEEKLTGVFGDDWPQGLTRDENALDLAWHLKEFDLARSFAWTIRDASGRYLGCAYLMPDPGARGRADAWVWFRVDALSEAAETVAILAIHDWLRTASPVTVRFPQNAI